MMDAHTVALDALHRLGGTSTLGGVMTVAKLGEQETKGALRQLRDAGLVALRGGRYEICDPGGKITIARPQPTILELAVQAHRTAKAAEAEARNARLAAEEKALRLAGIKEEDVTSIQTDWFRARKLGRTLVPALLAEMQSQAPQAQLQHAIRCKLELSLAGLENGNPEIFARAIVIKPAKLSVKKESV